MGDVVVLLNKLEVAFARDLLFETARNCFEVFPLADLALDPQRYQEPLVALVVERAIVAANVSHKLLRSFRRQSPWVIQFRIARADAVLVSAILKGALDRQNRTPRASRNGIYWLAFTTCGAFATAVTGRRGTRVTKSPARKRDARNALARAAAIKRGIEILTREDKTRPIDALLGFSE